MHDQTLILDCTEQSALAVGSPIDAGNGALGEVVAIHPEGDEEGGAPQVAVLWPDATEPERFTSRPLDYRSEGPEPTKWVCDELAVKLAHSDDPALAGLRSRLEVGEAE